ncbi:keywimysin-related RiPP [Nocardiopsis halophila]|nr:keywimysin-related RiPP [Nocardiopsis halophila]
MKKYTTPALTRIGSFRKLTKSLGRLPCNDIFGQKALWTTSPNC